MLRASRLLKVMPSIDMKVAIFRYGSDIAQGPQTRDLPPILESRAGIQRPPTSVGKDTRPKVATGLAVSIGELAATPVKPMVGAHPLGGSEGPSKSQLTL